MIGCGQKCGKPVFGFPCFCPSDRMTIRLSEMFFSINPQFFYRIFHRKFNSIYSSIYNGLNDFFHRDFHRKFHRFMCLIIILVSEKTLLREWNVL